MTDDQPTPAEALAAIERSRRAVQERVATAATEGELQAARSIQLGMVPPRERLRGIDPRVDVDALRSRRALARDRAHPAARPGCTVPHAAHVRSAGLS